MCDGKNRQEGNVVLGLGAEGDLFFNMPWETWTLSFVFCVLGKSPKMLYQLWEELSLPQ